MSLFRLLLSIYPLPYPFVTTPSLNDFLTLTTKQCTYASKSNDAISHLPNEPVRKIFSIYFLSLPARLSFLTLITSPDSHLSGQVNHPDSSLSFPFQKE